MDWKDWSGLDWTGLDWTLRGYIKPKKQKKRIGWATCCSSPCARVSNSSNHSLSSPSSSAAAASSEEVPRPIEPVNMEEVD